MTPRIISDNGPQLIAKDFKEFIRICGMTAGSQAGSRSGKEEATASSRASGHPGRPTRSR